MEDSKEEIDLELEETYKINDTYTILLERKIGEGSFGQIYQCINIKTKEILACKIESINAFNPQIYHESKIMSLMKGYTGFPNFYKLLYTEQDKILIMDLLGANLETIMNKLPNKTFTIKSSLMIMTQCIQRLKDLHEKGIIHRDMKPENFVIGKKNKESTIYLIDFGLSKKFLNDNHVHIPMKTGRSAIGTVKYISMNTHQGIEQSRRDDLESLFYIIIYFIKGKLPWEGIKSKTKTEKYKKIFEVKKQSIENNGLCGDLICEFNIILKYIINLEFTEKPDYNKILKLIEIIMEKYNCSYDLQFDWYNLAFLKNLYKNAETNIENKKSSGNNEIIEINECKNKNERRSNDSLNMRNSDKENNFKKNKYRHSVEKFSVSNKNLKQLKKNKGNVCSLKKNIDNRYIKINLNNMKNNNKIRSRISCIRNYAMIKIPNNI